MKTEEVWQEYDPAFYAMLTDSGDYGKLTRKLYYIGLTLPDLLSGASNPGNGLSVLIRKLYYARDTVLLLIDSLDSLVDVEVHLRGPLRILDETHYRAWDPIQLAGDPHDATIWREMREYVRYELPDLYWGGFDIPEEPVKALVYGGYMHVVQDYIAHRVLQPANFGYGYAVESDSALDWSILSFPASYHSLLTDTHIPHEDTAFICDLFRGEVQPGSYLGYPGHLEFWSVLDGGGQWNRGWQQMVFDPSPYPEEGILFYGLDFLAISGQLRGLFSSTDTEYLLQQLGSYMHVWAISSFLLCGYKGDYEGIGGLMLSPEWTGSDIKDFWNDVILQWVDADLSGPWEWIPLLDWLVNNVFVPLAKVEFERSNRLISLLNLPINLDAMEYVAWSALLEDTSGLDYLWSIIDDSLKTDSLRNQFYDLRREVKYWQRYSQPVDRVPSFRGIYSDELEKSLAFTFFYQEALAHGFEFPERNQSQLKAGVLGGMWPVYGNENEYYDQPGVVDLNFYQGGSVIYTPQTIPLEGVPDITINLNYDLVTFGGTKVKVRGILGVGDTLDLAWQQLDGPDRKTGSLSFNAQDAVNEGADTVFFEVQTADSTNPNQYTTMFKSDYREPYNTHPEIYTNPYYQTYFVNGNPVRTQSQNPITDPAHYWPYVLPLKDTLTVLNAPSALSSDVGDLWTSVTLTWQDNSNYEDGYVVRRHALLEPHPSDSVVDFYLTSQTGEVTFVDTTVEPSSDYLYEVWAYSGDLSSDTLQVSVRTYFHNLAFDGPISPDSTALNTGRQLLFKDGIMDLAFTTSIHSDPDTSPDSLYFMQSMDTGVTWTGGTIYWVGGDTSLTGVCIAGDPHYPSLLLVETIDNERGHILSTLRFGKSLGGSWSFYDLVDHYPPVVGFDMDVEGGDAMVAYLDEDGDLYAMRFTLQDPSGAPVLISADVDSKPVVRNWNGHFYLLYSSSGVPHLLRFGDGLDWTEIPGFGNYPSGLVSMVPDGDYMRIVFGFRGTFTVTYWALDTLGNLTLEREFSVNHVVDELFLSEVSEGGRMVLYYWGDTDDKLYMLDLSGEVLGERELSLSGVYGFCGGVTYWGVGEEVNGPIYRWDKMGVGLPSSDFGERDGIGASGSYGRSGGADIDTAETPKISTVFAYVFEGDGDWYFGLKRWWGLNWVPGSGFSGGPQGGGGMTLNWGLLGVYPNPVSDRMFFSLLMSEEGKVGLKVYDVSGRLVKERVYGPIGPGGVRLEFKRGGLPQGVYFYRLRVKGRTYRGKFSVVR